MAISKRPLLNWGNEQRAALQRELGQFVEAVRKGLQEGGDLLWRQLFNIFQCGFIGFVCFLAGGLDLLIGCIFGGVGLRLCFCFCLCCLVDLGLDGIGVDLDPLRCGQEVVRVVFA